MASAAMDLLIGKIASAIQNEASSLGSVRYELEELKHEVVSMRSFLQDVGINEMHSEGRKTWVANVRDTAYEVEDIIDEFTYHMNQQCIGGSFSKFLHRLILFPRRFWIMHQTASKLQKINRTINSIHDRNQRYGVGHKDRASSNDDHGWLMKHRELSRFVNEDDLVGIERESQLLTRLLMDEEQHRTVISVVGMGGSGKTALVANIFKKVSAKRDVDCYAWITVSQTYTTENLFRSLIKELYQSRKEVSPTDLDAMSHDKLVGLLMRYLEPKRYLVVLDDVWDRNLMREIEVTLPDNQLKSRIVLTTRIESVASFCSGVKSQMLQIQPLAKSEAWELFCKKAFSTSPNRSCPRGIETLAWELVEKCEGLPLAIVTLGRLMSSKNSIAEWRNISSNLNWQLSHNLMLEALKSILLLSFEDLPCPLKYCFLYCCLFPEDYLIRRKQLIRLWIAEGFIQPFNRITPEDLAESYLMELISRNMLQVVRRNDYGRPKACKMHDLMRELALSISEREKFCAVYDGKVAIEGCEARRLSIHKTDGDIQSCCISKLRSFFFFASGSQSILATMLPKFKLLRILDLEDVPIEKLPDDLECLFNLRYLNLRGTRVAELPKFIGRLCNLQALDIRNTQIKELPNAVAKLQKLWYLLTHRHNSGNWTEFHYVSGTKVHFEISKLKKLRVLSCVEATSNTVREVGRLSQLVRIGITNIRATNDVDLCSSLQNLDKLQSLFLMVKDEDEYLQIGTLSSPPPQLTVLILVGKLERVPHWFCSLQCLTTLGLHWPRLKEDPLPYLAALPNLGRLELCNSFVGEKLCFSEGFSKLTRLYLGNFPQLRKIIIEKGAMPNLQEMFLISCINLNALPLGIEYLTNLQLLYLVSLPKDLLMNTDNAKLQHIPKILHKDCEVKKPPVWPVETLLQLETDFLVQ